MPLVRVSNGGSLESGVCIKSSTTDSISLTKAEISQYKYVALIATAMNYSVSTGAGTRITSVSRSPIVALDTYGQSPSMGSCGTTSTNRGGQNWNSRNDYLKRSNDHD